MNKKGERQIGFSNGTAHRLINPNTKENIDLLKNCGCSAIEIHRPEDESTRDILPYIKDFSYISIHLSNCNSLDEAVDFYKMSDAQLMVVHPDIIEDWSVFDRFPFVNWAFENMDEKKLSFQGLDDFRKIFKQKNNWSMVLDLAHCHANDKTMRLANGFINEFKNRIKEIHLSGNIVLHESLYQTKQVEIIKYCKKLDVPIIIESTLEETDDLEGVKREFDYILENLK